MKESVEEKSVTEITEAEFSFIFHPMEAVALMYTVKEITEHMNGDKLSFDQANGLRSAFNTCKRLLQTHAIHKYFISAPEHRILSEFYSHDIAPGDIFIIKGLGMHGLEPGKTYLFPLGNPILSENEHAKVLIVPDGWEGGGEMWMQDASYFEGPANQNNVVTVGGNAYINEDGKVYRLKSKSYGQMIFGTKKEFLDSIKSLPMVPAGLLPQADSPLSGDALLPSHDPPGVVIPSDDFSDMPF